MKGLAKLIHVEAESDGQVRIVRTSDDLLTCLNERVLAMILHFEGAEAIDTDLDALDVFYAAGLRSLGITWSRPTAFGTGVPFAFPSGPQTSVPA
jgi:membrane dipeptidase